ncbi:hypothetical protein [Streptomyces sp. NPDC058644]|uniref:hypothetical protein n=1 Tax=unclassified Streptomyces TaxID=2593676 RepID=UPI00364E0EA0
MASLIKQGAAKQAQHEARRATAVIQGCRPQDREALHTALAEALVAPASSTAVTLKPYTEVEGVPTLVRKAATLLRRADEQRTRPADAAGPVAELIVEARLKMLNKCGLPDITADSKFTKDIARELYAAVPNSLVRAVRNRMTDVVVARLRSLDEHPQNFPAGALEKARAAFPDLSATEAVYALYEECGIPLPRKGRTELAREDARARAALVEKAKAAGL